jgi:hypothetical protein
MIRNFALAFVVCSSLIAAMPSAHAHDPFAFQFGYTLGYQNSFRNRLPAPPYFAVYPPVYYGQRYRRPYGDSPFASWPTLQSAPGYHAVPAEGQFRSTRTIVNPHVELPHVKINESAGKEPVADIPVTVPKAGSKVTVVNPYAFEQVAQGGH